MVPNALNFGHGIVAINSFRISAFIVSNALNFGQGIEAMIRDEIPEISEVLDTTDHAAGENPYYEP